MSKRALVALVCCLSVAACRNASRDGAIRVAIDYSGFVPGCIEVTASEAEAGGDSSTVRLGPDALAGHRRAVVAVFRKPEWIRSIGVRVRSFETNCLGSAVEEIAAPESIDIDSAGTVRDLQIDLHAVDADGDRFAARAGSVQGTDCDDARSDVHPGAAEPCGNFDFDCDGLNGCTRSACHAQPCSGSGIDGGICGLDARCVDPNFPFPYAPLNFTPALVIPSGSLTIGCALTYNTTLEAFSGCNGEPRPSQTTITLPDGREAIVLATSDLTLQTNGSITLVGERPVILAVYGNATIDGRVTVSSRGVSQYGAGHDPSLCGTQSGGTGSSSPAYAGGGGGGGLATPGGAGGRGSFDGGTGGTGGTAAATVSGFPALSPSLRGGCAGGAGGNGNNQIAGGGAGGAGGGAIQISVAGLLTMNGTVSASGAGGGTGTLDDSGGGGGGSGGVVLLEGYTVRINRDARLAANGGGGGSGSHSDPGRRGSDGSDFSAVPAAGGSDSPAGAGGTGGFSSTSPTSGADGDNSGGGGGGGGGGGATGAIYVRAGNTASSSCERVSGFVQSPPIVFDATSCP